MAKEGYGYDFTFINQEKIISKEGLAKYLNCEVQYFDMQSAGSNGILLTSNTRFIFDQNSINDCRYRDTTGGHDLAPGRIFQPGARYIQAIAFCRDPYKVTEMQDHDQYIGYDYPLNSDSLIQSPVIVQKDIDGYHLTSTQLATGISSIDPNIQVIAVNCQGLVDTSLLITPLDDTQPGGVYVSAGDAGYLLHLKTSKDIHSRSVHLQNTCYALNIGKIYTKCYNDYDLSGLDPVKLQYHANVSSNRTVSDISKLSSGYEGDSTLYQGNKTQGPLEMNGNFQLRKYGPEYMGWNYISKGPILLCSNQLVAENSTKTHTISRHSKYIQVDSDYYLLDPSDQIILLYEQPDLAEMRKTVPDGSYYGTGNDFKYNSIPCYSWTAGSGSSGAHAQGPGLTTSYSKGYLHDHYMTGLVSSAMEHTLTKPIKLSYTYSYKTYNMNGPIDDHNYVISNQNIIDQTNNQTFNWKNIPFLSVNEILINNNIKGQLEEGGKIRRGKQTIDDYGHNWPKQDYWTHANDGSRATPREIIIEGEGPYLYNYQDQPIHIDFTDFQYKHEVTVDEVNPSYHARHYRAGTFYSFLPNYNGLLTKGVTLGKYQSLNTTEDSGVTFFTNFYGANQIESATYYLFLIHTKPVNLYPISLGPQYYSMQTGTDFYTLNLQSLYKGKIKIITYNQDIIFINDQNFQNVLSQNGGFYANLQSSDNTLKVYYYESGKKQFLTNNMFYIQFQQVFKN